MCGTPAPAASGFHSSLPELSCCPASCLPEQQIITGCHIIQSSHVSLVQQPKCVRPKLLKCLWAREWTSDCFGGRARTLVVAATVTPHQCDEHVSSKGIKLYINVAETFRAAINKQRALNPSVPSLGWLQMLTRNQVRREAASNKDDRLVPIRKQTLVNWLNWPHIGNVKGYSVTWKNIKTTDVLTVTQPTWWWCPLCLLLPLTLRLVPDEELSRGRTWVQAHLWGKAGAPRATVTRCHLLTYKAVVADKTRGAAGSSPHLSWEFWQWNYESHHLPQEGGKGCLGDERLHRQTI